MTARGVIISSGCWLGAKNKYLGPLLLTALLWFLDQLLYFPMKASRVQQIHTKLNKRPGHQYCFQQPSPHLSCGLRSALPVAHREKGGCSDKEVFQIRGAYHRKSAELVRQSEDVSPKIRLSWPVLRRSQASLDLDEGSPKRVKCLAVII